MVNLAEKGQNTKRNVRTFGIIAALIVGAVVIWAAFNVIAYANNGLISASIESSVTQGASKEETPVSVEDWANIDPEDEPVKLKMIVLTVKHSIGALAVGSVYTITLDGNSPTTAGTSQVYLKYGSGWYLDSGASSQRMSSTANGVTVPVRKAMKGVTREWLYDDDMNRLGTGTATYEETDHNYRFGGFYTGANGTGVQVIGEDGKLRAGVDEMLNVLFDGNATLYARWYCTITYLDDDWNECAVVETQLGVPIEADVTKIPRPEGAKEELGYFPGMWTDINMQTTTTGRRRRLVLDYYRCKSEVSEAQLVPCDCDTELSLSYWRVLHYFHYIDGLTTLDTDSKYLQIYSTSYANNIGTSVSYIEDLDPVWFDSHFNGSSLSPNTIDNVYGSRFSKGWECVGWQGYSSEATMKSTPPLTNKSKYLGLPGYADGNWWGAVYERDVTVHYNKNRMSGGDGLTDTLMSQSITTHAPTSSMPYGIIGASRSAVNGGPIGAINTSELSMPNHNFYGFCATPAKYDWESDPGGAGVLQVQDWTIEGKSNTRKATFPRGNAYYYEDVTVDSGITQTSLWTDDPIEITLYAIERPNMYLIYSDAQTYDRMASVTGRESFSFYEFYGVGYSLDYGYTQLIRREGETDGSVLPMPSGKIGQFDGYYTEVDGDGIRIITSKGCIVSSADATEFTGASESTTNRAYETWTLPMASMDLSTGTLTMFSSQDSIGGQEFYSYYDLSSWPVPRTVKDVAGNVYSGNVFIGFGNGYYKRSEAFPSTSDYQWDGAYEESSFIELIMGANSKSIIKHVRVAEGQRVHLTNCAYMFANQTTLEDVSGFDRVDTDDCWSFRRMFANCTKLRRVDGIQNWDVSAAEAFDGMFENCRSLQVAPNLSSWNLSNAKTLATMFEGCISMETTPDTSYWGVSSKCTNLEAMFADCIKMPVRPMLSGWDTTNVTTMRRMFQNCASMEGVPDVRGWSVGNLGDIAYIFQNCRKMPSAPNMEPWHTARLTDVRYAFAGCAAMTTAPVVSGWNTGGCTSLSHMFDGCIAMAGVPDVSGWNTSNVVEANNMFANCKAMTSAPDLSAWSVANLKDVAQMFYHCEAMTSVPKLFNWTCVDDTSVEGLFTECKAMAGKLDLSGWNLSHLTSTFAAFWDCAKVTELDISNWVTTGTASNVGMFDHMNALKAVTLGRGFTFTDADDHGSAYASYTCKLPTPMPHGLWINSSHADAQGVTPDQLKENWSAAGTNNSYNAGRYVTALVLKYMNHDAEMDRSWVPWDTDFSASDASSMTNKPAFEGGTGWTFAGWAANDTTNTVSYETGDDVKVTDDGALYCVYSRDLTYTYYPSATATSTRTDTVEQFYRSGQTQSTDVPTAVASTAYGWTPVGWCKGLDGATSYDAVHLAADTTNPDASSVNTDFHAVYERDAVTINYNGNNNTGGSTASTKLKQNFVAGAGVSTLPSGELADNGFTKTDCDFVCWTLGSTDGDEYYTDDLVVDDSAFGTASAWNTASAGAVTMYAMWTVTNISFTLPTQVPFAILADGTMASPSANSAKIGNTSAFPIDVIGCKVTEYNGVDIVEHVTAGNQMAVTMQAQGYAVQKVCDLVSATWKDISWHIAKDAKLGLTFGAEDVVKIDALGSEGAKFGKMEFMVEGDV